MKELPTSYSSLDTEAKRRNMWYERGVFHANPVSTKPHFTVMMPPPNVTGVLHMGHAMDETLQDILVRWKKMHGYDVLWVPGTDHAGIATQTVVERNLMKSEGKRRTDYPREVFLQKVFEWKEKSQAHILSQVRALGCACDWDRLRFTMDERCSKAVRTMFKRLFELGLIYRGNYLVNWDTVTGTALADDEVEYEERQGFLWTIRYPLKQGDEALFVSTTRPETMLGDTALAVHPEDPRYKAFVGQEVIHPITHHIIPIIADSYVDPEFGTGVVKITPAHDPNDYQMALRHNLSMVNILTKEGRINEEGLEYKGMSVLEAREAIVQRLEKQQSLARVEPHLHRVGVSYRSKAVIEPMLSKQWYVRVSSIKGPLRKYVEEKQVKIFPSHWESTYFQWIDNLRDWCISRQLWWGHRIPIWYNKKNQDLMLCTDSEEPPEEVQAHPDEWEQDPDVLDTWFSSGLWPFSTLGWPEKTADLAAYFPNSTLITGHDIIFFWMARMVMMSHFAFNQVPFHETFLHGLIYSKSYWRKKEGEAVAYVSHEERKAFDLGTVPIPSDVSSKWEKMSKSKGNVIDPLEIVEEYGADAMRFALASSVTDARQIDLDRRKFEEFRNFTNKIWNGARFVLLQVSQDAPSLDSCFEAYSETLLQIEDRWILSRFHRALKELESHLASYAFDKASTIAYSFFWDDFCSWWIECSKPALFGKEGEALQKNKKALASILLLDTMKMLHPFAPFITEELYSYLKELLQPIPCTTLHSYVFEGLHSLHQAEVLAEALFPKEVPLFSHEEIDFARLQNAITQIRAVRGEMKIPPGTPIELELFAPKGSDLLHLIKQEERLVKLIVKAHTISSHEMESKRPSFGSSCSLEDVEMVVPLPTELQEQEKKRLEKEIGKLSLSIEKTKQQLARPGFKEKAPSHLIEGLEKGLLQQEKDLALLQANLKRFEA